MDKNGSEVKVFNPINPGGKKKEERMSLWQRRMQRKIGQPASDKTLPVAKFSQAKAKKSRQREPALTPIQKKAEGPDYAVFNALKIWSIPK